MDCVILFRNTLNGVVGFVTDDDGEIKVFSDREDAIEATGYVPILQAYPYQIVELDEL